ncbi:MAG: lipopolysaccharide kinase InaA family protein [Marinifilaceae bacterium]|jgi:serine/threonine protein kinase|nr:lipopolysaccharide kinase InaA family protein [Marinifilaceae bacterium]
MNIKVSNKYLNLLPFIKTIPDIFDKEGNTIYEGRNTIKTFEVDGEILNVKSFKKPNIINKIVYKYFRDSKAKHSYDYASRLFDLGISTPEPIAYIEEKDILFSKSYYICKHLSYDYTIWAFIEEGKKYNDLFLHDFCEFMYEVHNQGVFHNDLSPGNILINENNLGFKFDLVDVNRTRFYSLNIKSRSRNFSKLYVSERMLIDIATSYAKIANYNIDDFVSMTLKFYQNHMKKVRRKKLRKKIFKNLFKRNR